MQINLQRCVCVCVCVRALLLTLNRLRFKNWDIIYMYSNKTGKRIIMIKQIT